MYTKDIKFPWPLSRPSYKAFFEDNAAKISIENSDLPTKYLQYVNVQYFSLLKRVHEGEMSLLTISTNNNPS